MRSRFFNPQRKDHPNSGEEVLEGRWLHKAMVFFNKPANWPLASVIFIEGLMSLSVGMIWLVFTHSFWWLTGIALLSQAFPLADLGLLRELPRKSLSFGPPGAQAIVLGLGRMSGAMLASSLLVWLPPMGVLLILIVIQLCASAVLQWGAVHEPSQLRVSVETRISNALPRRSTPIRLLHISDLHVERVSTRENHLLALIRDLAPEIIVFTGDYLNLSYVHDETAHAQLISYLRHFEAPGGVYATMGSPPVDIRSITTGLFGGMPVRLLRDEWLQVGLSEGRKLILVGLDCTHEATFDAGRLRSLMKEVPSDGPRVLLYHSPELGDAIDGYTFDLYLCGHTHGGQVRLPFWGAVITSSSLGKRYEKGRYEVNGTTMYVSRGIGFEGLCMPRVRFLSPPEVTLFEIRSCSSGDDHNLS